MRPLSAAVLFALVATGSLAFMPGLVSAAVFLAGPAATGLAFSRQQTRFTSASLGACLGSAVTSATWILTHPEDGVSYWAAIAGALVSIVIVTVAGAGVSALVARKLPEAPVAGD